MRSGPAHRAPGAAALGVLAAGLAWAPPTALALGAGGAAALATAAWPALALAVVAVAVPFGPLAALPLGGASLTLVPVLVAWAACARLGRGLVARRVWLPSRGLLWPLALMLLALLTSAWGAPDWRAAGLELARWLVLALALVLAADLAGRGQAVRLVLTVLLVAGALEAVVGARQALAGAGPEAFAIAGGRTRAFGDFGQPNPFGGYMNMVWPLGLALVAPWLGGRRAGRRPTVPGWLRVLGLAAGGLAGLGLLLSWSRGAWLAAMVGAAAMALVWLAAVLRPPVRPVALLALIAGLMLALTGLAVGGLARSPAAITARLGSVAETFAVWDVADVEVNDANFATVERVAHWQAAAAMWADRPWVGQGPGQYELAYPRFRLARWPEPLGHAHNLYLHLAAETGLLGLAAYLLLLGSFALIALRAALAPATPLQAALGLGAVGVLAALAFHSLTDNLYVHDLAAQIGLIVGLTVAAGGRA